MAIGDLVKRLLGRGSGVQLRSFRCSACEATFESAKRPDRATCPECLSAEVSVADTTDSHA